MKIKEKDFNAKYLGVFEPSKGKCPACKTGELKFYLSGRIKCTGSPDKNGCGFERK